MATKRAPSKKSSAKKSAGKKSSAKSSKKPSARLARPIDKFPPEPGDVFPTKPGVPVRPSSDPSPACVFDCAQRFTENLASGLDIATCMRRLNRCIKKCLGGAADLEAWIE